MVFMGVFIQGLDILHIGGLSDPSSDGVWFEFELTYISKEFCGL